MPGGVAGVAAIVVAPLCRSPNRYTQIWGYGTGGTCVASGGGTVLVLFPLVQTHTVYARIPLSQYVAAGDYSDTIAVQALY